MRFNICAEIGFFQHESYPTFERLLAAAAGGCMSVNAVKQGELIDVQINPVLMATTVGQYVFNPTAQGPRFRESLQGRSIVTIEMIHIDEQTGGDHEQLLCNVAVVLVKSIYGVWHNQNCWSRLYGGTTTNTGWCDRQFPDMEVAETRTVVEEFANNKISATEMVERLRRPLIDIWKD